MIEKVADSIKFLLSEYERLLQKQKNRKLSKSELETLNSLKNFVSIFFGNPIISYKA